MKQSEITKKIEDFIRKEFRTDADIEITKKYVESITGFEETTISWDVDIKFECRIQ